jgi:hypothetical protein
MEGNMKTKTLLIASIPIVLAIFSIHAQTTNITFEKLLSSTNSVLMTNAEFRCFSGARIFFRNADGYRAFYPGELNSNVLTALHTSIIQLAAQQQALIDANQRQWDAANPAPPIYTPPVDDIFERAKNATIP